MAPGDGGEGWSRPAGAPPGTPHFEPPPFYGTHAGAAGPPAPPDGSGVAPAWAQVAVEAPRRGRWSMTRGWAWTAFGLLALIPIGAAATAAFVIVNETNYDPEIDGEEEAWVSFFAVFAYFLFAGACAVAAGVAAIIGAFRSRRRPEIRQAPVIAVLVWVALGLIAAPVVLSLIGGGVETLFR